MTQPTSKRLVTEASLSIESDRVIAAETTRTETAYASKATPAAYTGYAGVKGYDGRLSTYNLKPKHLLKTRAALAQVAAGTGHFNLACVGDSTTYGLGSVPGVSTYPDQLQKQLAAAGYPAAGSLTAGTSASAVDGRITKGAGWAPFSDRSSILNNSTTTNPLTFAFTASSTYVRVFYYDYWGGSPWTITIDGGTPVNITSAGTNLVKTWTSPALTSGPHTVVINRVGGNVYIIGVETATSITTGTRLYNAGFSGGKMAQFASASLAIDLTPVAAVGFDAHLTILGSIVNDSTAGTSVATYKAQLKTAVANLRVGGGDIVLGTLLPPQSQTITVLAPYLKAVYEVADELDLPVVDFYDRWTGVFQSGHMSDAVHGSPAGYSDYARMMLKALGV